MSRRPPPPAPPAPPRWSREEEEAHAAYVREQRAKVEEATRGLAALRDRYGWTVLWVAWQHFASTGIKENDDHDDR